MPQIGLVRVINRLLNEMTEFHRLFSRYFRQCVSAIQKTGNTFAIPDFCKTCDFRLKILSMIRKNFAIAFDYQLEDSSVRLPLLADVEQHHSETWSPAHFSTPYFVPFTRHELKQI
jgi:hypothetical protein